MTYADVLIQFHISTILFFAGLFWVWNLIVRLFRA